jgi:diguanylate cyclase (GGDEF)-like protein/PAS domain S-box-containing protein
MEPRSIGPTRAWVVLASLLVCTQLALALSLKPSYPLTTFGDTSQCILLLGALLSVIPIAFHTDRRTRLFGWLICLGFSLWLSAQFLWTYFEVYRRQPVPNPFVGDIVLFLHIVPMMAALAVQPHFQKANRSIRAGRLDFALLFIWWLYLYLFAVIPWQYVSPNESVYGSGFDNAYLAEHLVFLVALGWAWRSSATHWKTIYAYLFGASCLYAVASEITGAAINFHVYYTGGLYDVPLLAAMAWFIAAGFVARTNLHNVQAAKPSDNDPAIWPARLAMVAVFSTPLMVAWSEFSPNTPGPVRKYRLLLTIATMLVLGSLVFLKQYLVDRELVCLLRESNHSFDNLNRLQNQLVLAEEKYRAIFEDAVVGIFQTTPDGRPISINRALAEMHKYDSPEQFLKEVLDVVGQLFVDPGRMSDLRQRLAKDGIVRGAEVEVYCSDRTKKWVLMNLRTVCDGAGNIVLHEGTVEDITDRKAAEEKVQYLAYYDALTGVANRTLVRDRLSKALARARRQEEKVALLFLDLDRFKDINDSLGHAVGDLLLQEVAQRLKTWAREQDTVARLSGDEFLIVLTKVRDISDAAVAAERLMDAMAPEFEVQGHVLGITCSLGISIFPEHGADAEMLIKNADAAMYCSKDCGRNNYRFFTEDMNARVMERLTLERSLRLALEKKQLFLVYQPQMDIRTGKTIGLEALLRWQHPELGLVSPDRFIKIAENSGLIIPIGEWVLRTACSQARQWQDEGLLAVPVAVNVSAVQFRQEGFQELVAKVLHETRLASQYLELELTESVLLSNAQVTFSVLQDLRTMGLKLAIDDFGTGYSSLSYLKQFPVSKLKIDRSFVREVAVNPDDAAITAAIIAMARKLSLKVLAEGVETEEQMAFLRLHQCGEIQGYYFSKPLAAHEAGVKLRADYPEVNIQARAHAGKP